jgi:hypothetical protein
MCPGLWTSFQRLAVGVTEYYVIANYHACVISVGLAHQLPRLDVDNVRILICYRRRVLGLKECTSLVPLTIPSQEWHRVCEKDVFITTPLLSHRTVLRTT